MPWHFTETACHWSFFPEANVSSLLDFNCFVDILPNLSALFGTAAFITGPIFCAPAVESGPMNGPLRLATNLLTWIFKLFSNSKSSETNWSFPLTAISNKLTMQPSNDCWASLGSLPTAFTKLVAIDMQFLKAAFEFWPVKVGFHQNVTIRFHWDIMLHQVNWIVCGWLQWRLHTLGEVPSGKERTQFKWPSVAKNVPALESVLNEFIAIAHPRVPSHSNILGRASVFFCWTHCRSTWTLLVLLLKKSMAPWS